MLQSKVTLGEQDTTLLRSASLSLVDNIKFILNLPNKLKLDLDDNDNIDRVKKTNDKIETVSSSLTEELKIRYEDGIAENMNNSMIHRSKNMKSIYKDDSTLTSITPLYSKHKMTLTLTYFNKSKSSVTSLVNKLNQKMVAGSNNYVNDITYSYPLPDYVLYLLSHINNLKNKRYEEAVDFDDNLAMYTDDRFVVNHSGTDDSSKASLSIGETQEGLIGYFEGNLNDIKKDFDSETNRWYIDFSYSVVYDYPTQLLLQYPILIFNTVIDKRFMKFVNNKKIPVNGNRYGMNKSIKVVDDLNSNLTIDSNNYYLTIPKQDKFMLPKPQPYYARVFSGMLVVDNEDDTNYLMSLTKLTKVSLKECFIDYLKLTHMDVFKAFNNLFYIELYNNNSLVSNVELTMDENLNIYSNVPLDIFGTYRLSFSVITDLAILTSNAKSKLSDYSLSNEVGLLDIYNGYTTLLNIDNEYYDIYNEANGEFSLDSNILFKIKPVEYAKYFTVSTSMVVAGILENKGK